jgi:hypothetical protein
MGLRNPTTQVLLRLTRTLHDNLAFPLRLFLRFFKPCIPRILGFIRASFQLVSGFLSLHPAPAKTSSPAIFRTVHAFFCKAQWVQLHSVGYVFQTLTGGSASLGDAIDDLVFALFIKLFSAFDFRTSAFSCSLGFRLCGPFNVLVNLRAISRHASGFVDGWLGLPPLDVRFLCGGKVLPEGAYGG